MECVTIVETAVLQKLMAKIQIMSDHFNQITYDLKEAKSPYMDSKQVTAITGNGKTWLNDNKHLIGFSKPNGQLQFKRSNAMEYMERNNHQAKKRK